MTSVLGSMFGYGQQTKSEPTTQRGLPSSWYRSKNMYELERRAIFSQKWIMITHRCRFTEPGDYARFTVAGFSFFLCLDRTGTLGGFHNICRHRAFPLIHEESGNAKILACQYHGWSYGINGKLAKAPYFETFPDFDKEQNGLLRVHVHIDRLGFVWVNLDGGKQPKTAWNDDFLGVDTQERFQPYDFSKYRFDHTWRMDGNYNWKTLADNYNECLHCKVAHPDVAGLADITLYNVKSENFHMQHYSTKKGQVSGGREFKIGSTYYFPNSCMTVSPYFFYMMRCVPVSESECSMEYEVYRHVDATDEEFEHIDSMFKRILKEDKWLCNATQRNLNAGVYVNGPVHPAYEEGPLYFQSLVKSIVMNHRAEEERQGKQIWPASQNVQALTGTTKEMQFCAALDAEGAKKVEW